MQFIFSFFVVILQFRWQSCECEHEHGIGYACVRTCVHTCVLKFDENKQNQSSFTYIKFGKSAYHILWSLCHVVTTRRNQKSLAFYFLRFILDTESHIEEWNRGVLPLMKWFFFDFFVHLLRFITYFLWLLNRERKRAHEIKDFDWQFKRNPCRKVLSILYNVESEWVRERER